MAKKSYEIAFEIGGKLQASLPKSMTSAAGQLGKLGQQISALEKAQGTSNRFRALRNEIDATKLKLRQAEGEVRHLGSVVGPMTAEMARKFAAAKTRAEDLRLQFRGQATELKSVRAAMDAAGISTRTFAADNAKLAANMAKAQLAQKKARENLGARAANRTKMDETRAKLGASKGTMLAAAAGVAAFALPAKIAADFEDSMVRAGALARATDGELAKLTSTARQLGRDTRFSATGAAEGMQYLATAGFITSQIIAAMPGMLDIAAAGAVDLATASDITSNILKGFNMQAGESGRLGDVLTNAFTQSNTTLASLGDTMKYVGPIASATKVSLETTAAAAGLLGNAGIKGEQAGTALRAMITRLVAPARKGQAVLDKLRIKTKDLHGNMRPLADILADMSGKMAKYGSATRQAMTAHVFGLEAATAATVLIGEAGSGNLQKFTKAVAKSGTAAEIAAKQNATMKGQWDNLKGSVEDMAIATGNTLIPVLKRLIDQIVPVVNSVTMWLEKHPQLTQALVVGGAALATLVLGLTVAAVAFNGMKLAVLATHGVMLLMNAATYKAAAAFAVAHGPMMLAIAGVAGLAYAANNLRQNWNVVAQWWDELWDGMYNKVAQVWNAIPKWVRKGLSIYTSAGLIGSEDMSLDVLKKNAASQLKLGRDLGGYKAYEPWRAGAGDEGAEPTWLKKKGAPPSAADGLAARAAAVSAAPRKGGITYAPQINVAPGSAKDARPELEKGIEAAKKDFAKMMERMMADQKRVAFD